MKTKTISAAGTVANNGYPIAVTKYDNRGKIIAQATVLSLEGARAFLDNLNDDGTPKRATIIASARPPITSAAEREARDFGGIPEDDEFDPTPRDDLGALGME